LSILLYMASEAYANDIDVLHIKRINFDVLGNDDILRNSVPSTLNFAIANGMIVRDTAETEYMQRKLIKSLEDLMIKYDGTVRNTNGMIVRDTAETGYMQRKLIKSLKDLMIKYDGIVRNANDT
jgi:hypothetical protein